MPVQNNKKKIMSKREFSLKGHSLSKGVAVARICLFNDTVHREPSYYKINVDNIDKEKKRIERAFNEAIEKTTSIKKETAQKLGKSEAGIFEAHLMILKDRSVRRKIDTAVEQKHLNAEAAVSEIFEDYEKRIASIDDEYLKQRSSDIAEIKSRILSHLGKTDSAFNCKDQTYCVRGKNRIIVAEELTPHLTMDMNTANVAGFITEKGGPGSHAAILARALGIPAVSGLQGIHSFLNCGMEVIVDGDSGKVLVNPSEEAVSKVKEIKAKGLIKISKVSPVKNVKVLANVNTSSDIAEAVEMDAEGIGLYRTEFEFIREGKMLSEEEQYELYVKAVKEMKDKPVYFRMLDLGSDKPAPGLKYMREENPALGLRGARLLEANEDLLEAQSRALSGASLYGNVNVMVPMVIDTKQFLNIKKKFYKAIEGRKSGDIKFGAMFEVPAACLQADNILKEADFASIGSNDLVQYLFAVDRNNDSVSYDYHPDREVLWTLLKNMADAAHRHKRPISICGEMAAEIEFLKKILDAGINTVSVSPRFIPEVRKNASGQLKKKE